MIIDTQTTNFSARNNFFAMRTVRSPILLTEFRSGDYRGHNKNS